MSKRSILVCVGVGLLAASGCGGDSGASSGTEGIGSGVETGDGNADNGEGVDGSGDTSTSTDPTTGDPTTGDPTTGDPTTSDSDDADDGADGGQVKWDTTSVPDGGAQCGGGGGNGEPEFSFLWAANSSEGTISKIDTKTVTEVGRFMTRSDSNGSPSRTSVSLSGHVAVANRNGGVTKIYADQQFCQESNGIPGIQTSTNNVALPWDQEECRAWHTPMAYASQRPVAWGPGTFNQGTCQWEEEEVWTAATQGSTIDVFVLDGDDGSTKEMITLQGVQANYYGIYGAAIDGDGNFWGSQLGSGGKLIKVNRADMSYQLWDSPSGPHWYGMTVDNEGMVWLCSDTVGRFDPQTQTWATASVGGWTGCMADASDNGLLWMSTGQGLVGVNRDTLLVEKTWNTGGSYGVSIDFEGYVWTVAFGNNAHKVDPETGQVWTYGGLVGAYTYSDMTGYALSNAGTPSG